MRNWYYFVWLGGDLIVEQTVHMIDVANWAKGGHPVEANGMGGRQVRTGKDHGQVYDHFFVEYTYADGTKLFCQARHIPGCFNCGEVAVHGPLGMAYCSGRITGKQRVALRRAEGQRARPGARGPRSPPSARARSTTRAGTAPRAA